MQTAERYRKRAEDVRALAEGMTSDIRTMMLALAGQWENLARQSEDLAKLREELRRL